MKHLIAAILLILFGMNMVQSQTLQTATLRPVYYDLHKRVLYNPEGHRIAGPSFLDLCRSIPDSAVKAEVARYDALTRNKLHLGLMALGSGSLGFGLLSLAGAQSSNQGYNGGTTNQDAIGACIGLGVTCLVAVPIALMATTAPHQQRKIILFHDLPQAYNRYVESLTSKH